MLPVLKGPALYPYLDLYSSTRTLVEPLCTINYPKTIWISRNQHNYPFVYSFLRQSISFAGNCNKAKGFLLKLMLCRTWLEEDRNVEAGGSL